MTAKDIGTHVGASGGVQVRTEGDVGADELAYVQAKLDAVLDRPGTRATNGVMRIVKSAAHHAERPWSAEAEFVVANWLVVVHAREATARELADRLADRLRGRMNRAQHREDAARRSATPPPWRGGRSESGPR
ncbi:hypothetical protein [Streptomyces olivochromogenes]|uniref:hypothetical protein n=1 Tax=Streptomyces olivochromogenes TaxID=1963 RepID=UPI001F2F00C7|nr:hypothetical protein [Streptomyces olivochromogenes]MCF3131841.1 hypothetical protein [Streptomyces olivochromogenes]